MLSRYIYAEKGIFKLPKLSKTKTKICIVMLRLIFSLNSLRIVTQKQKHHLPIFLELQFMEN